MASNGGVQNKIAILGSYGGSNRPIIGMSYVLINNASLGPKVKNLSTSRHAEYPQLHSPARAQRKSEICSREVFL